MQYGDTTTLTGSSGRQYRFDIFPKGTAYQAKPGVYVMAREKADTTNGYEFCFVGETADLSKQPWAPDKIPCFTRFGVNAIFLIEEYDANKRAQVVRDLVQAYVPSCNTL
ncbi:MAG: hypothetical protein ABL932_03245 [Terricaulis sp.]